MPDMFVESLLLELTSVMRHGNVTGGGEANEK
jgi:hypothetical protein